MTTRLQRRGYPAAVINMVMEALTQRGALNDRQFATLWARSRAMSAHGSRAITRELSAHGIAPPIIADTLTALRSDYDERAAAHQFAERRLARYRCESVPTQWRRLSAQLARRAFPGDIIEDVLRQCLKPLQDR